MFDDRPLRLSLSCSRYLTHFQRISKFSPDLTGNDAIIVSDTTSAQWRT